MITCSVCGCMGRTGNAMFQMATLINTALYNGYEYGIPLTENKKYKYFVQDPRGAFRYHLDLDEAFNLTAKDASNIIPKYHYSQTDFNYNPDILDIKDDTDIVGYFQSERYFKLYEKDIRKEFTFKPEILIKATDLYYNLKNEYILPLVAMHIRRGDYLTLPDHHPLCTIEYYKNGIELIKRQLNTDIVCVVFSDDLEWCKLNFNEYPNTIFINNDTFTDLCLMSMCDHHIIANSSYSWWGSYLQNTEHITVAPQKWFGPKHNTLNTKDLLPKVWIKI